MDPEYYRLLYAMNEAVAAADQAQRAADALDEVATDARVAFNDYKKRFYEPKDVPIQTTIVGSYIRPPFTLEEE